MSEAAAALRAPGEDPAGFIRANTEVASPWLCPEIHLHLVTEACPLWRACEEDLEALGLPSPFWAFCWAGGEALARFLLDQPERVAGRRVLDLGAGGGVEAIAAALGGGRVLASDLDPMALRCLELNAELNGVAVGTTHCDWLREPAPDADLVLVGDVTYDDELAGSVLAWLDSLVARGVPVLLADPGRGCIPEAFGARLRPLAEYRPPADNDRGQRSLVRTPVCELR